MEETDSRDMGMYERNIERRSEKQKPEKQWTWVVYKRKIWQKYGGGGCMEEI